MRNMISGILSVMLLILVFSDSGVAVAALVDNGDSTVTDTQNGLMWQQTTAPGRYTWQQALSYCEGLTLGGHSDWRLPNRNELQTLVDYSRYNPAIDPLLAAGTMSSYYWSSSTYASNTGYAWRVYFSLGGGVSGYDKSYSYYVRAVRAGQAGSLGDSVILTISAYDSSTGSPVTGADVVVGGRSGQTDEAGMAVVSGLSTRTYTVRISKTGFADYSTQATLTQAGSARLNCGLTPVVAVSYTNPVVLDVVSAYSNKSKEAFFLDGVDADVEFSASVNWNGKTPGTIRFITPHASYEEPSGTRVFNVGREFGPGGRLSVVAVSQDGVESEPFDTNIEVMPLPPGLPICPFITQNANSLSYHLEIKDTYSFFTDIVPVEGLTVSEDIPIFGDRQISLGIGADIYANIGSDGTATYQLIDPVQLNRADENALKMAGASFKCQVGGKIVFNYAKGGAWDLDGGYVLTGVSTGKKIGPSYTLVTFGPVIVPVYLRGELSAKLDGSIGLTGWAEGDGWQLDGTLEPGAGGKAVAGVGLSGALSLEGYLGIDVDSLYGFPESPLIREASVALSGGIQYVTLFFKYEKPLWEYTWSWPEAEASSVRTVLSLPEGEDIRTLDWKPIERGYSAGQAPAAGIRVPLSLTDQTLTGQTDIYPYSTPHLIRIGDELLLVWITDDLTKTDSNRTSLVFSRYADNQWTDPAKVAEDGTADFYPQTAPTTGGAVAAWQDSGMEFAADAAIEDMLCRQEISVCRYDTASGGWGAYTRLTDNGFLDRSPTVAASGDKAVAVWISNDQNDMLGSADKPNNLNYSVFDGQSWSAAQSFAMGLNAVIKTALSCDGAGASFVFVVDGDGDMATDGDQELYAATFDGASWSAPAPLTADSVQDTNPQLARDVNGDLLLVWYRDGNFAMIRNLDLATIQTVVEHGASSGAADFRLVTGQNGQLSILWPDASSRGQDIFMAMYDPNLNIWGKGAMVTDTDAVERSLTGAQTADGSMMAVYNRVETVMTSRQVTVGDTVREVRVPEPGKTDLCFLMITIDGDLTVDAQSVSITPTEISPETPLEVVAVISNQGLKGAENIAVEFYYGDPAGGGSLIGTRQIITGPLAAGDSAQVSVTGWTPPDMSAGAQDIYVVVDPDLACEDKDRTNNVARVSVFKPDLEIFQISSQNIGPVKRAIVASVKNIGPEAASQVPVILRKGAAEGTLLHQQVIETLRPDEVIDIVYEWDTAAEQPVDGYLTAWASVNAEQTIDESSYINNSRTVRVPGALPFMADNPSIVSGSTGISLLPVLDWEDVSGAVVYDLYLWLDGTARPLGPTAAGLTESRFAVPAGLLSSTVYCWQVVSKNSSGETISDPWTFTTREATAGDINDDGTIDLTDVIKALQVISGISPDGGICTTADVNADGQIGIEEALFDLETVSGIRSETTSP